MSQENRKFQFFYWGNIDTYQSVTLEEALELLYQTQKLELNEKAEFYILDQSVDEKPVETNLRPSEKQVKITAIFFRADKDFFNSVGVNWQTLFNGKVLANIDFKGGNNVASDLISASGSYQISQNDYVIDLASMLRFVESNQKGSVIAHPNISVLSGKEGKIQVGQDFSIKKSDEAGNITDEFFSTGVILKVKPTIIQNDSINIIHLAASVEKSSATPGAISTIINKNEANTEVYLFDGEETVIGGLYDVEYTQQRGGIPFLKDLPWWVFGIKYLTGYNIYEQHNREMIVIIKAELYESIEQRMRNKLNCKKRLKNSAIAQMIKYLMIKPSKLKEKKKN